MEGWNKFIGKKVFIETKSSRRYSGKLLSIDDPKNLVQFINLEDKYGKPVCISIEEINLIQQENEQ